VTTGFTDERVREWVAAAPRRWPRWILTGLWIAAFIVSMESDDEPCTTADLTVCGPDLAFSVSITFCFAALVLVWWRPLVAAVCAVVFAGADIAFDYLWQAKVSWSVVAVAFVLYAAHLRSSAVRQRRMAHEASVPLVTRPQVAVRLPPLNQWQVGMAVASFVLVLVVVGTAIGYLQAVARDADHVRGSEVVAATVLTDEDDDGYQRVRVTSVPEGVPAELDIYFLDVPDVGEGVSIRVDPDDLSWTHPVAEPPDRTWWVTIALGALVLAALLLERLVSMRARQRWLGSEPFASGVPVRAADRGGELRLRSLDSSRPLARLDSDTPFEEERAAGWSLGPTLPDTYLVGDVRDGGWAMLTRGAQVIVPRGPLLAEVDVLRERVVGVELRSMKEMAAVVGYVLGIVLGCGLVWFGITEAGPSWAASQGRGVPGKLVVTDESCSKSCDYYGTFTSDDGRYVFRDVNIVGDGDEVGETVPALYQGRGEEPDAVYAPGWNGLFEAGLFVAMGGGLVLGCAGALAEPYLLRRPGGGRHERLD
jgi:hypothetical protein